MRVKILKDEVAFDFEDTMDFDTVFDVVSNDCGCIQIALEDLKAAGAGEMFRSCNLYSFYAHELEVIDD